MSIYTDMLKLGNNDIPCNRTKVLSKVSLRLVGKKWTLDVEDTESIVSLMGVTRSGTKATPRPFIDKVEYTFGVNVVHGPNDTVVVTYTDKAKRNHEAYVLAIANSGLADTDKNVKSFLEFISSDPYQKLIQGKNEAAVNAVNKTLLLGDGAIRVCVGNDSFAEKYADLFSEKSAGRVRCVLSGELEDDLDIKPEALHNMKGGVSNMIPISCNTPAFPVLINYNFAEMDGSPVSIQSKQIITRNLQHLLSTKNLRIRVRNSNGITYLFNYEKATEEEKTVINAIMDTPDKIEYLLDSHLLDDEEVGKYKYDGNKEERCEKIVWDKYESIQKSRSSSGRTGKLNRMLTVYRIHAAQGRWSCTDTFKVDLDTLFANIDRWFDDTVVGTGSAQGGIAPSIYRLLRATRSDDGQYSYRDYENIIRSILLGTVINVNIMRDVLHRAEITHRSGITGGETVKNQMSLIRACYNSRARHNNRKELSDMLDKNNISFAYNLGRLLAVGDYVQYKVHNDKCGSLMSAGLDKRAVVRPVECQSAVLNRIKQYSTQICRSAGKQFVLRNVTKLVDEITTNLKGHPGSLNIDEQAEMRSAYWQQRQEFYNKQSTNTNNKKD